MSNNYQYRIEVTNGLEAHDVLENCNFDSIVEDNAIFVNPWLLAPIIDILDREKLLRVNDERYIGNEPD